MLYEDLKKDGFLENNKLYKKGGCADIFIYKDALVKLYRNSAPEQFKIKRNIFDLLKEIDNKSFVSLENPIYKGKETNYSPDGYTMKEVKGDEVNLLTCDSAYLIEMIRRLDNVANILTKNKIKIADTSQYNIIFTENNVTIIDPDLYSKSFLSKERLSKKNKLAIMEYINNTLIQNFIDFEHIKLKRYTLSMKGINGDTNLEEFYSKKLVKKKIYENLKDIQ